MTGEIVKEAMWKKCLLKNQQNTFVISLLNTGNVHHSFLCSKISFVQNDLVHYVTFRILFEGIRWLFRKQSSNSWWIAKKSDFRWLLWRKFIKVRSGDYGGHSIYRLLSIEFWMIRYLVEKYDGFLHSPKLARVLDK